MPDKERQFGSGHSEEESRDWWKELERLGARDESWCCRVSKEGNFEEETRRTFYSLLGKGMPLLRAHFCLHCGRPRLDPAEIIIDHEECCCRFSTMVEFAEIFDPLAAGVHRLRGNFCFNCGKEIRKMPCNHFGDQGGN